MKTQRCAGPMNISTPEGRAHAVKILGEEIVAAVERRMRQPVGDHAMEASALPGRTWFKIFCRCGWSIGPIETILEGRREYERHLLERASSPARGGR